LRSRRLCVYGLGITAALLCGLWLLSPALASPVSPEKIKQLRKQAAKYERQYNWEKACEVYEQLLRLNSQLPEVRARYRHALRRYYQVRRHQDSTYRKDVLTLKYSQSLRLYEIVQFNLLEGSLDKHRLDAGRLFRKGLEEFISALADPTFCETHLRGLRPEQTRDFRTYLRQQWGSPASPLTREQAADQVRAVAMKALSVLRLNATTTVMEFTCGSCYAIDEYNVYLTPGQARNWPACSRKASTSASASASRSSTTSS